MLQHRLLGFASISVHGKLIPVMFEPMDNNLALVQFFGDSSNHMQVIDQSRLHSFPYTFETDCPEIKNMWECANLHYKLCCDWGVIEQNSLSCASLIVPSFRNQVVRSRLNDDSKSFIDPKLLQSEKRPRKIQKKIKQLKFISEQEVIQIFMSSQVKPKYLHSLEMFFSFFEFCLSKSINKTAIFETCFNFSDTDQASYRKLLRDFNTSKESSSLREGRDIHFGRIMAFCMLAFGPSIMRIFGTKALPWEVIDCATNQKVFSRFEKMIKFRALVRKQECSPPESYSKWINSLKLKIDQDQKFVSDLL